MELRSNLFISFWLLILGTFFYRHTFDVSSSLTPEPISLLLISLGTDIPPTIVNFFLGKIAQLFLLCGFLTVFRRIGRPVGGFAGVLLLSIHPLVSHNSGYLAVFTGVIALVWWSVAFTHQYESTRKYVFPATISLAAAFFLSPWMLLLPAIAMILDSRDRNSFQNVKKFSPPLYLVLFGVILFITVLMSTQELQKNLLSQEGLGWLKNCLLAGQSLDFIYSWGALVILCFALFSGVYLYPQMTLYFLIISGVIISFMGLDLIGILVLWIIIATLAAVTFDVCWKYLAGIYPIWITNLLAVLLITLLFNIDQKGNLETLMQSQKNQRFFAHKCGKYIVHPDNPAKKMLFVNPELSQEEGCFASAQNYHYSIPGRYRARFFVCQTGSSSSFADIAQDHGEKILAVKNIPEANPKSECSQSLQSLDVEYTVTKSKPGAILEHRVFYSGQGVLHFDRVELELLNGAF